MSFYQNGVRDERVREYLPVQRVLWQQDCRNAGQLAGNCALQIELGENGDVPEVDEGGGILLDFGCELHGGVRLLSVGESGVQVRLRFGESVSEAMGTPNQDHAMHDAVLTLPVLGMLEYGNTAFRFVRLDAVKGKLRLMNVLAVALFRDLEYTGCFHSSDGRLNKIWATAVYTVHLNMQDYIYDGVKRDRLVWMGDMNPEVRGILCAFRDTALIAGTLDFLRETTPLPRMMNGIPSYSCWWVITIYDYYLHSGDFAWLSAQRGYLMELLGILVTFVDGKGSECIPPFRFLDWPNDSNEAAKHAGLQGLLLWTLQRGIALGKILDFDTSVIAATARRMRQCIPDCGESKAAAAMQCLSGLADRTGVLLRNPFCGVSTFYGYYMLQAMPVHNALELIRRYWGAMLDYGATTFWEDFDLGWIRNAASIAELPPPGKNDLHADFGNYCYKGLRHSLCHGWACGPAPFLSERVLGVHILEPGCRRLRIAPELCGLEYLQGRFPTPQGAVEIQVERGRPPLIKAPGSIQIEEGTPG